LISKLNGISFKLGLLFSGIFITLLLLLGPILYGVFTNMFVDYIKQDLLAKGQNHARILEEDFNQSAINYVVEMEKGVMTEVLVLRIAQVLSLLLIGVAVFLIGFRRWKGFLNSKPTKSI